MQDQKAYEAFTQTVSTELRSFLHAMDFSSLVAAADLIDNAMQRGNRVNGIPFVPQKLRNFPAILEHRKIQTNPL